MSTALVHRTPERQTESRSEAPPSLARSQVVVVRGGANLSFTAEAGSSGQLNHRY